MNQDEKSEFITLLASLMDERAVQKNKLIEEIADFQKKVDEDFKDAITDTKETTAYSDAPMMLKRLDDFMESLTNLALCPEIHDKILVYKSGTYMNTIKGLKEFCDSSINRLMQLDIKVPVLICNGESLHISCMTYSDKRVEFSEEDFFKLILGAESNNIDLNTTVKYVVISTPLSVHGYVFLAGNSKKKFFKDYINKYIKYKNFSEMIKNDTDKIAYYGLLFRFNSIVVPVSAFYQTQINSCSAMIKNITNDLIKLDGKNDNLKEMRETIKKRKELLEKHLSVISVIVGELDAKLSEIEIEMGNTFDVYNFINPDVCLYILELIIIKCESGSFEKAEEYYSYLVKTNYEYIELVAEYIYCVKNNQEVVFSDTFNCNDWRIIKMTVAVSDISDYKNVYIMNKLKNWVGKIDGHISTPKEKFVKAITLPASDLIRNRYLKESFMGNYAPAGQLLLQEYSDAAELDFLADCLQPDACIYKGDEAIKEYDGYFLDEPSFFYYKLAASTGNTEAVEKIVNLIYDKQFKNLPSKSTIDSSEKIKRDLEILIPLCSYLVNEGVSPAKYNNIQGVLYYLKNNHAMAMSTLSGVNTVIANYCKGKMYENGWGTAVDLNQALTHYTKAISFKDSSECINNVTSKINKKKEEEKKASTYNSSSNYSSTKSNYSSSSSGCFITTAAVKNICAADDCEELEIMRNFRDSFINKTDAGQSLTLEYYRVAPIIVQCIDNDPECTQIYKNIWQNYINKSLVCIRNGEKKQAQIIYINMVQMLAEKYGVEVREDIVKKYLCSIADE